jgi:hypothetical protein
MNLKDLYKKEGDGTAPSVTPPAVTSVESASAPEKASAPILQTPPGLPQEYIDANLMNQALPVVTEQQVEEAKTKPLNYRVLATGETLCHKDNIPYHPGVEGKLIQERIAQGPRVFVSRAQKERFERDPDEKTTPTQNDPKGPTLAHPDTLRAGTVIRGDAVIYRPGA